jgi:predicted O-methyltransferase YrrM
MSALYFAAAIRYNGGGAVIGSELVPEKLANARRNLAEAGLADFADIRQGDARETLRDLGGPVDFVQIDGWPGGKGPSLARQVMEIVAPQIRADLARRSCLFIKALREIGGQKIVISFTM